MQPSLTTRRLSALRRARARRRNAGAVIFIVSMTLGVLAVMGAYALSATTRDLHAAGKVQHGMQAINTTYYTATVAAQHVDYVNADDIINRRMVNPKVGSSDQACLSNVRNVAATQGDERTKSCVRIGAILTATGYKGEFINKWGTRQPFTDQSFQHNATATEVIDTDVYMEFSNPVNFAPPPGYGVSSANSGMRFVMVTTNSFGINKPRGTSGLETVRQGRGRFIIGPIAQ